MTTPNEELINNLTIKAGVMEMGEKIAWGSDTALMRQAAATLQSQAERIAELERESETHAKAYGLAIVERDNLHHELKVAQEGWRCECSTDDACRFARERDALRAQLAEIAATEPVCLIPDYELDYMQTHACGAVYKIGSDEAWDNDADIKLFTRPMPAQLSEMEARKDAAYLERNQLVSLLSKLFPSGIKRTAIEGWSDDWHGCVYIDLPTGQASWHYHDSQAYL